MKNANRAYKGKLMDRLLEELVLPPLPSNKESILDPVAVRRHNLAIRGLLKDCVCFDVTNVNEYFEETYTNDSNAAGSYFNDLKCLVPPFPRFFVEWQNPLIGGMVVMGLLVTACRPHEAQAKLLEMLPNASHSLKIIEEFRQNPECAWILLAWDFIQFPKPEPGLYPEDSRLRGPYTNWVVSAKENGVFLNCFGGYGAHDRMPEDEMAAIGAAGLPAWMGLNMLNCHNIDTVKHEPPPKLVKSRKKKGKRALVPYRTIRVNQAKTPGNVRAPSLRDGNGEPVNVRRGHLKDYREGAGLFGKYKGLWYWGPILREDGENEVIYEVEA